MAFKRVKGGDRGFVERTTASIAWTVGDLAQYSRTAGTVTAATSSTLMEDVAGICVEATTTAATTVLLQEIQDGDEYIVDTTNNPVVAEKYQKMVVGANAYTINNTHTDSDAPEALFMQTDVVGALQTRRF